MRALNTDPVRPAAIMLKRRKLLGLQAPTGAASPVLPRSQARQKKSAQSKPLAQAKSTLAMATAREGSGNYSEAEQLYEQSLKLLSRLKAGDEVVALRVNAMASLGRLCILGVSYAQARRRYLKARELARVALGTNSLQTIPVLNGLGAVSK